MVKPTSFNLEDAQCLFEQLNQFRVTLQQEWDKVDTQWENLKSTWHDQQFDKFEPLFEKLSSTYQHEINECENYMLFLDQRIKTAEQSKVNLGNILGNMVNKGVTVEQSKVNLGNILGNMVKKGVTVVEMAQAIVGLASASPPLEIPLSSAQSISSIEQKKDDNLSYFAPKIVSGLSGEEQLEEFFVSSEENNRKKRQEELEKNVNLDEQLNSNTSLDEPKSIT